MIFFNFYCFVWCRFNWGLNVRTKSKRILKFLNELSLLKEERARARKLSRGIEGFGSFNHRVSLENGVFQQSFNDKYKRSNSQFIEHQNLEENQILPVIQDGKFESRNPIKKITENADSNIGSSDNVTIGNLGSQWSLKENMVPKEDRVLVPIVESSPLLGDEKKDLWVMVEGDEEEYPFKEEENEAKMSLI